MCVEQIIRKSIDVPPLAGRQAVPAQVARINRAAERNKVAGEDLIAAAVLAVTMDDGDSGSGFPVAAPLPEEQRKTVLRLKMPFVVANSIPPVT